MGRVLAHGWGRNGRRHQQVAREHLLACDFRFNRNDAFGRKPMPPNQMHLSGLKSPNERRGGGILTESRCNCPRAAPFPLDTKVSKDCRPYAIQVFGEMLRHRNAINIIFICIFNMSVLNRRPNPNSYHDFAKCTA